MIAILVFICDIMIVILCANILSLTERNWMHKSPWLFPTGFRLIHKIFWKLRVSLTLCNLTHNMKWQTECSQFFTEIGTLSVMRISGKFPFLYHHWNKVCYTKKTLSFLNGSCKMTKLALHKSNTGSHHEFQDLVHFCLLRYHRL